MEVLWNTNTALTAADQRAAAFAAEIQKSREFAKVLQEVDAYIKSKQQTDRQKAEEAKELQEKQDREKKIAELRGLIAYLRQRLVSSGYDRAIAAQLSTAETQLFWLLSQV